MRAGRTEGALCCLVPLLLVGGCSSTPERAPPPVGLDLEARSEDSRSEEAPFSSEGLVAPARELCGETVVEWEWVRPSLYFLLDASGSMELDMPGSFQGRYDAALDAIQELLTDVGHRVNYGASVFPAGEAECGAAREVYETAPGDSVSHALSGELGPKLLQLLRGLTRINPGGATPTGAAVRAAGEILNELPGQRFLFLVTDGAPNCGNATCPAESCVANIESWLYAPEEECEAPVNCCSNDIFGPSACLDADPTVQAVAELFELGVQTFVIGIPGTEVYGDLLDELARAGGTPRDAETDYFRVDDATELSDTLTALGQDVSLDCEVELFEAPPDRELVNVFFDEMLVPQDSEDGWRWVDDGRIEVVGPACDLLEEGQVGQLQVAVGCPAVVR